MTKWRKKTCQRGAAAACFAAGLMVVSMPVIGDDAYQLRALLQPSDAVLRAERLGRITIYDGLDNDTVELALNRQFDRIENMMFVRIRHPLPDGDYDAEEDGCD